MSHEALSGETCAECGRLVIRDDKAPPIQAGPLPIVPTPPTPAKHPKCDDCGRLLLDAHDAG